MNDLDRARGRIDEADRRMAELFEQRMDAVRDVIAYKQAHGLPILDSGRESLILERNAGYLHNPEYVPYYERFMRDVMSVSKAWQRAAVNGDVVAYPGAEGAFSHIAMERIFKDRKSRSYPTFQEVFAAVSGGDAACGVIPFENSYTGEVGEVLDLLLQTDVHITGVYDLRIRQNLLGLPGARLEEIKRVYSHPQAIGQSQEFLRRHNLEAVPYPNTALAAKHVSQCGDPACGAIASAETAELYGLQLLAANINTSAENTTRFIVIERLLKPESGNRFNLLFTVSHDPGQLANIMRIIGEMGFNLESIKSRPLHNVPWQYYFYVEIIGSLRDEKSVRLLDELKQHCRSLKVLGTYALDAAAGEE